MKYIFPMEKILELRSTKEKDAMERFGAIQSELSQKKEVLYTLREMLEREKNRKPKRLTVQELTLKQLYKEDLENRILNQIKEINQTKEKLEIARQELIEAQKDRKVMEKLKEKDYEEYMENMKAIEQKELDEMAVLRSRN